MAVINAKWLGDYPLRTGRPESYILILEFETNSTSAPDGLVPNVTGVTLGRTGVGDLTVTFAEDVKPNQVLFCEPSVVEDDPDLNAKYTGYTKATGVLTLTTYDGGVAADTDDQTVQLLIVATRSDKA